MRAVLGLSIAFAGLVVGCDNSNQQAGKQYPNIIFTTTHESAGDARWYICWGETKDVLAFVLFEKKTPPVQRIIVKATNESVNGWLLKPDGTKIRLPTDVQLYEIVEGKCYERDGRITMDELYAFLYSNPKEYTIAALLRFAKKGEQ